MGNNERVIKQGTPEWREMMAKTAAEAKPALDRIRDVPALPLDIGRWTEADNYDGWFITEDWSEILVLAQEDGVWTIQADDPHQVTADDLDAAARIVRAASKEQA